MCVCVYTGKQRKERKDYSIVVTVLQRLVADSKHSKGKKNAGGNRIEEDDDDKKFYIFKENHIFLLLLLLFFFSPGSSLIWALFPLLAILNTAVAASFRAKDRERGNLLLLFLLLLLLPFTTKSVVAIKPSVSRFSPTTLFFLSFFLSFFLWGR